MADSGIPGKLGNPPSCGVTPYIQSKTGPAVLNPAVSDSSDPDARSSDPRCGDLDLEGAADPDESDHDDFDSDFDDLGDTAVASEAGVVSDDSAG